MEAIIRFNLPEEQEEYDRANKATALCSFIWDFEKYLRGQRKYGGTDDINTQWDKWHEMKGENDINLDAIYT